MNNGMPVIRQGTRYGIRWKVVSVSGQGIVQHFFRRERENHG